MTTIYTIYGGDCPIYQSTNYSQVKKLWDEVVKSMGYAQEIKACYTLKKGDELMFEVRGAEM